MEVNSLSFLSSTKPDMMSPSGSSPHSGEGLAGELSSLGGFLSSTTGTTTSASSESNQEHVPVPATLATVPEASTPAPTDVELIAPLPPLELNGNILHPPPAMPYGDADDPALPGPLVFDLAHADPM